MNMQKWLSWWCGMQRNTLTFQWVATNSLEFFFNVGNKKHGYHLNLHALQLRLKQVGLHLCWHLEKHEYIWGCLMSYMFSALEWARVSYLPGPNYSLSDHYSQGKEHKTLWFYSAPQFSFLFLCKSQRSNERGEPSFLFSFSVAREPRPLFSFSIVGRTTLFFFHLQKNLIPIERYKSWNKRTEFLIHYCNGWNPL